MLQISRRHAAPHDQRDEGIAMVVAISLIAIVGMLIAVLVAVAMYESAATGRDRQRSQAVMAAELRVDTLMSQIQARDLTLLPCGDVGTAPVSLVSDRLDVEATVTYYDDASPIPNVIPCTSVQSGVTEAHQALIQATAVSEAINAQRPAERTVEMLISLEPNYGNDLDKAIFGNAGVRLANKADIYGQNGQPDADVYTNGDVICDNQQHYHGSIFAQGSVYMSNSCTVEVDVYAKTGFFATNPSVKVNGRVLVSHGNATLDKMQIGQYAQVNSPRTVTSHSNGPCDTAGKCLVAPAGTIQAPPQIDFPILNWDAATQAQWAANGYANVVTFSGSQCGMYGAPGPLNGKVDMVAKWIVENMATLTQNTVVVSKCPGVPVTLQGVGFNLNANLAIFSDAGVKFTNNSPITSTTTASRNLYLVQPYNAAPSSPCTSEGITLDNQVTVAPNVNVLMYSPCNIRKANNTTHYGQIYAGGQATIDNQLTMYYNPLPVWGVMTASTSIESYNVEILYKRENA